MNNNDAEFTDILRIQGVNAKGYGIVPKIPMQDERLKPTAKLIYAYFCSFAGAGDTAFPSVRKIMKDLGIKDMDTLRKHRKQLEQCGYIKVEQSVRKGVFGSNIYTIISNPEAETVENRQVSPLPKKPVTEKNRNGKNPLPKKPVTKINSILKINSINKNNTHTDLKNLCVEIEATLGEKISQKKVQELINLAGIETVQKYIDTWDKYKAFARQGQASYFIYCIQHQIPVPTPQATPYQNSNIPQYANFEQRRYSEEDYERFYDNLNS